jgi:TolB protein
VDLSHDDKQLAISSDRRGNHDLWVLPAAGGEMTRVTTDPTPDWRPSWSPDDSQIVFYSYRSGNRDIWVMPATGGPAKQLTFHSATDDMPSWSPDGRIAFHSDRDNSLWIISPDGGEPRRRTGGFYHDWSPDGGWLALVAPSGLHRIEVDGAEPVFLSTGEIRPSRPRVSHDGRSIYYTVISEAREHQQVWRLSLSDGQNSPLTNLEGRRGQLEGDFAAGSEYLYFIWREDEGDIWVMDVEPPRGR